ncbi:MAG: hypothetical protein KIT43_12980 [Bauldia sp.]|nr:hypothetical protein [Bauldia sp.]
MRLKSLLLGTSAAMFVGGASITTAQAADPNPAGLVVTTMANYVEQCNNGNGWKKRDWCITLSGSIEWSTSFGYELDYGDDPWDTDRDPVGTPFVFPVLSGLPTSYFGLSGTLTVTVSKPTDAGNLSFSFNPLSDSVGTLSIGPWQFNANQVRYRNTFGPATITATLAEPGRLGWNDPRGSVYSPFWNGPWPDFALDVALDIGAAEVTTGFNVGQRTNDSRPAPNFNGDGHVFMTLGGYVQGEFGAGPADMTVRFDYDRVNASEDGTGVPVWAFGLMAEAELSFGNFTITPSVGWSRNYGYYGYKYDEHELGTYLMAGVDVEIAIGDMLTFETGVEYTRGPDAPADAVLEITGGVTFEPAGASPVYVTLEGTYARQFGGNSLNAFGVELSVGARF